MNLARATRRQVKIRMASSLKAASAVAAAGRTPRSNAGQPLAVELMLCGLRQGGRAALPSARRFIAQFEVAWRIQTPDAAALRRKLIIDKLSRRAMAHARFELSKIAPKAGEPFSKAFWKLGGPGHLDILTFRKQIEARLSCQK